MNFCWSVHLYTYVYYITYIYIWYHIYPKNAGNLGLHKPERRWHPAKSGIGKIIHTWIHSTKAHNVGQNCILPIYLLYYLQSAATSLQTKPNAYSLHFPTPPKKKKTCLDYFSGLGIRHPKKGTPHHISKALRHLRCFFFDFIPWLSWNWGVCGVGKYDARWW